MLRSDYTFVSWNTEPDGSGTVYMPGNVITITQNLILYAQWEVQPSGRVEVIYNPNGGTEGLIDNVLIGSTYIIKSPTETNTFRPGYEFTGWNTEPDGSGASYAPGTVTAIISDLFLYAQWSQLTYTITYHKNDPFVPDDQKVTYGPYASGTTVTLISIGQTGFFVPGFSFIVWNTQWDGSGNTYFANSLITVNADIDLYAMWMRRD